MGETGPLGNLSMAADSLYVSDLDASIAWYRDTLGLVPIFEGTDEHRYATYQVGGFLFVLEPTQALWKGNGVTGSGAATINLVTDRSPADIREELAGKQVECSDIVDSPGFSSFLFTDPDGNRFYVTCPRTKKAKAEVDTAVSGSA